MPVRLGARTWRPTHGMAWHGSLAPLMDPRWLRVGWIRYGGMYVRRGPGHMADGDAPLTSDVRLTSNHWVLIPNPAVALALPALLSLRIMDSHRNPQNFPISVASCK